MGRRFTQDKLDILLKNITDPGQVTLLRESDDPVFWAENHLFNPDNGEDPLKVKWQFYTMLRDSAKDIAMRTGRQLGKCESAHTHIQCADGSRPTAEELYKRVGENGSFPLISCDQTTMKHIPARGYITDNGRKPVVEIKTMSGFVTRNTDNHPYWIWRDTTYPEWIEGNNIRVGDRIAVTRDLSCCSVPETKSSLTTAEAELLGYLVGDGGTSQHTIKFTSKDTELIIRINEILAQLHTNMVLRKSYGDYNYSFINTNTVQRGRYVTSWITDFVFDHKYNGKLAIEKHVPEQLFTSSDQTIAAFIGAYLSTDGWVCSLKNNTASQIGFGSSSRQLLEGVRVLLLRLGILSRLYTKKIKYKGTYRNAWQLLIHDSFSLQKFSDMIPVYHRKKSDELSRLYIKKHNSNTNTIPKGVWKYILRKLTELNWPQCRICGTTNERVRTRYSPNRVTFSRQIQSLHDTYLDNIAESDIYWDIVSEITACDNEQTYAISVPETQTLLTDNFITHNTVHLSIDILHTLLFNHNMTILIFVPEKKNMNRMLEIMGNMLRPSDLRSAFTMGARKKEKGVIEAEYDYEISCANGSVARFFFISHNPSKARGQSAMGNGKLIMDEVEFFPSKAFDVILGILKSDPTIKILASSTPSGIEGTWFRDFSDRCKSSSYLDGSEYHLPSTLEENWPEIEARLREVIFDEVTWQLEVLAEWTQPKGAVHKKELVDAAVERSKIGGQYLTLDEIYNTLDYADASKILGVDWNEPQNGVRLVEIAEMNLTGNTGAWVTRNERIAYEEYTQTRAVDRIIELFKKHRYKKIAVDSGYGETQIELIIQKLALLGVDPKAIIHIVNCNTTETEVITYTSPLSGARKKEEIRVRVKDKIVGLVSKYIEHTLVFPHEEDTRKEGIVKEIRNFRRKDVVQGGGFIYSENTHSLSALHMGMHAYHEYVKTRKSSIDTCSMIMTETNFSQLLANRHSKNNVLPVFGGNLSTYKSKRTQGLEDGRQRRSVF